MENEYLLAKERFYLMALAMAGVWEAERKAGCSMAVLRTQRLIAQTFCELAGGTFGGDFKNEVIGPLMYDSIIGGGYEGTSH